MKVLCACVCLCACCRYHCNCCYHPASTVHLYLYLYHYLYLYLYLYLYRPPLPLPLTSTSISTSTSTSTSTSASTSTSTSISTSTSASVSTSPFFVSMVSCVAASLVGAEAELRPLWAQLYVLGGFDGYKWLNDLNVLDIGKLEETAITSQVRTAVQLLTWDTIMTGDRGGAGCLVAAEGFAGVGQQSVIVPRHRVHCRGQTGVRTQVDAVWAESALPRHVPLW